MLEYRDINVAEAMGITTESAGYIMHILPFLKQNSMLVKQR